MWLIIWKFALDHIHTAAAVNPVNLVNPLTRLTKPIAAYSIPCTNTMLYSCFTAIWPVNAISLLISNSVHPVNLVNPLTRLTDAMRHLTGDNIESVIFSGR